MSKKPKTKVPQRANKGTTTLWKEGGGSPNPSGRFKLPDWFKDYGEQALAMQVAAGLGVVVEVKGDTIEGKLAREVMARDCPMPIRDATSNRIMERLYGPIKQEVKVDDTGVSPALQALLLLAGAHKPVAAQVFDDDDSED